MLILPASSVHERRSRHPRSQGHLARIVRRASFLKTAWLFR